MCGRYTLYDSQDIFDRFKAAPHPKDESLWLDSNITQPADLEQLLIPYPNNSLELITVSSDVNTPKNNYKELLTRIS